MLNLNFTDGKKKCLLVTNLFENFSSVVTLTKQSHNAKVRFEIIQKQLGIDPVLMLTNPGPTRWNGYYIMLDKCIELKQALILFFDEFNVEDPITKQEWDTASKILKVLKPLYDVTNEMSSDKHVSVSKVIPLVDILRQTYPVHEDYDDDDATLAEQFLFHHRQKFRYLRDMDCLVPILAS